MSNDLKVNNPESLQEIIKRVRTAQEKFSSFSQEKIDKIFKAVATALNTERIPLAKMASEETGMGIPEDKVIKNNYASEYIYNIYKNTKTCGIIEKNEAYGTMKIAEPIGLISAVIPTTNPTSTTIFKILIALKTRNGIIVSPHPRAKKCTIRTAQIALESAVKAGAPEDIIGWIDEPSIELTNNLMKESDIILATGGFGMVKSAYSSGKPALGVGAGNTPAIIEKSADIKLAVNSIIHSKTFDNGMICASEQSVIVDSEIYNEVREEFKYRGCLIMNPEQIQKIRNIMIKNGKLNAEIVGQSACRIAELAGFDKSEVPENTKILIAEIESSDILEPLAREKLSPILAMYRYENFNTALDIADRLIKDGGYGHTSAIYINESAQKDKLRRFAHRMKTCRILINTPASQGGIGDLYNFDLTPSLTLGCGSWGGNSTSENVGVKHLLNIKTVAERRENMLWLKVPKKVYFKRGCLPVALEELKGIKKRAFIVTDSFLYKNGMTSAVTRKLNELEIEYNIFYDVEPDPTLESTEKGAESMRNFEPDCIIAVGGGSALDAAKIMWLMYENPDTDFADLSMRFMDIRKRIYKFPAMGKKSCFIAVPTSSGTGSEVTPFAVITDQKTGIKYPLADYELMPNMAIIDTDLMMTAPPSLTSASGIDALTHALEAYVSVMASDYTDSIALGAMKNIFIYLPKAYSDGNDFYAREKMANASTMAGIAFANAFLGVCHSMAHKLGAFFHLPHGIANALLITETMRFNISEAPAKMGSFSQYQYPNCLNKYAEAGRYIGLSGEDNYDIFEKLIERIENLKNAVGIKSSIKEYEIDENEFLEKLDKMTELAFDDQCTGANPRYPLMSEIKNMYLKAYYGN
ncbi:MAG: bifunctional acetaldehyde-CoA/alcohol dehydrogenase [Oscillospiraceae bacterium]|nr:bifunctional acetaldehyde-CoA/alcohol dehydrogenase [Oscillospiraceae bacterium]